MMQLTLSALTSTFSIYKLNPETVIPSKVYTSAFFSLTKTTDELSLVCQSEIFIDQIMNVENDWRAFKVEGPLDFALTGILAALSAVLAQAGVSIFAISTFDTDYILMKEENFDKAKEVLACYHTVK